MALYAMLKRIFPKDVFDMRYLYRAEFGSIIEFMHMCMYSKMTHSVGKKL